MAPPAAGVYSSILQSLSNKKSKPETIMAPDDNDDDDKRLRSKREEKMMLIEEHSSSSFLQLEEDDDRRRGTNDDEEFHHDDDDGGSDNAATPVPHHHQQQRAPPVVPITTHHDEISYSDTDDRLSQTTTNDVSTHHSEDGTNSSPGGFVRSETKAVNRSKMIVYLSLLVAAAAVAGVTYYLLQTNERTQFETEFIVYAEEILHATETNVRSIFGQMHGLSVACTSIALAGNWTWPFVRIPHFELHAQDTMHYASAELVMLAPVVTDEQVSEWEQYSVQQQDWIYEDVASQGYNTSEVSIDPIPQHIFAWAENALHVKSEVYDVIDEAQQQLGDMRKVQVEHVEGIHVPIWQVSPVTVRDDNNGTLLHVNESIVNLDLETHPSFTRIVDNVFANHEHVLLSEVIDLNLLRELAHIGDDDDHPRSFVLQPVTSNFEVEHQVVAFLIAILDWEPYFTNVLPETTDGITVYMHDTCGSKFTYMIHGREAEFLGHGDWHHDPRYMYLNQTYDFAKDAIVVDNDNEIGLYCDYQVVIYPSTIFEAQYHTYAPAIYTAVVTFVFVFTILVFVIYDCMVQRRQDKVLSVAKRTNAVVASIFPKNVQKRILEEAQEQADEEERNKKKKKTGTSWSLVPAKQQLKGFLLDDDDDDNRHRSKDFQAGIGGGVFDTKPIADFFPAATIMFADIVGFTAWSSMREPAHVFTLLETIYHSFDEIAKRRRVFKVETVGDCYVAVAGLPQPRSDHAIVMARFARDCLLKMRSLIQQLELSLGPDTTDLGMRFGLHSGPCTAGVLRGARSRFQLFGDTVNTTARIETSGMKNKIHISSSMAELLTASGKGHWLIPRQDKVIAKGKGELVTFWLNFSLLRSSNTSSDMSSGNSNAGNDDDDLTTTAHDDGGTKSRNDHAGGKHARLIFWLSDVMGNLLKQIHKRRRSTTKQPDDDSTLRRLELETLHRRDTTTTVLDEVENIVVLPSFCAANGSGDDDDDALPPLPEQVMPQLQHYIRSVASTYRETNPFHNFEHASHVTMSVVKLLSRIVAPDLDAPVEQEHVAHILHDHTYGITSDPLTLFAVVLSALIHDADHPGVPNTQLCKEQAAMAAAYKYKSVAEQNSVDLAWNLLMDDDSYYAELRRAIYSTPAEFQRFRQLVVNTVLATDIMDKDLGALRKARWEKAFSKMSQSNIHDNEEEEDRNRKATIVIEHLIQASDVAHTMQHWQIYRKWNSRLFQELYLAFQQGRSEKNPSEFWYQGEIAFFDFYIIPLAKKLKDCGVFGVSSDEYLNYAQQNRKEWETKGEQIVQEMVEALT